MQINAHTTLNNCISSNSSFKSKSSETTCTSTAASAVWDAKIRVSHNSHGSCSGSIQNNITNNKTSAKQRWRRLAYSLRWRNEHAKLHDPTWPARCQSVYCAARTGVSSGTGSRKPFMRPIYRRPPAGSDGGGDNGGGGGGPGHEPTISSDNKQPAGPSTSPSSMPPSPPRSPPPHISDPILYALETIIERTIFNCRFVTLFAVVGSLAGSLLCFFQGCHFVKNSFFEYFRASFKGLDTSHIILSLVEAIDIFLVGTVMLIFGMGLYELFVNTLGFRKDRYTDKRGCVGSNLFGLFRIQERPLWLEIRSLDDLKTKVGHVIVMILLVGMFEKSKIVPINTGHDFLCFSCSILMAACCLFCLSKLNVGK